MLLNVQRHLLLLSADGLFLAHVCVGAVRRSEGFLPEPVHTVCMEKLFLRKHVHSSVVGGQGQLEWDSSHLFLQPICIAYSGCVKQWLKLEFCKTSWWSAIYCS